MTTPLPPTDPSRTDEPLPGEAELAALYRELPQSEPSPALDAAVLQAAAQALTGTAEPTVTERRRSPREPGDWVHPKPLSATTARAIPSIEAAARRRRAPRWMITLGSAASLVLVAGLAWQLRESSPLPSTPVAQEASTGATTAAAAKASAETTPPAEPLAPVVASEAVAPQLADRQAAMQASAANKLKQNDALQSAQRKTAARSMAAPPAVAELATPAPAPPAPPAPAQEMSANAVGGLLDKTDQAAAPPNAIQAAPTAAAPVATADQATSDTDTSPQPGDTPTQELAKIQQLFDHGHRAEALPRLQAFRQAHPQWPLSPALQAQLREP